MAYIRGHFYIYSSGDYMNLHHGWDHASEEECPMTENGNPTQVSIPTPIFEEVAVMYVSRMSDEEIDAAKDRAIRKYGGGNFGADALMEERGLPTVMDTVLSNLPDPAEPVVYHELTRNKVYRFIRIRIIGALGVVEGCGQILVGEKMPGLGLKAMFWELRSPRLRRWNRHTVERTRDNA